jgi:hypothetical protein
MTWKFSLVSDKEDQVHRYTYKENLFSYYFIVILLSIVVTSTIRTIILSVSKQTFNLQRKAGLPKKMKRFEELCVFQTFTFQTFTLSTYPDCFIGFLLGTGYFDTVISSDIILSYGSTYKMEFLVELVCHLGEDVI